jgi:hypothetical protein
MCRYRYAYKLKVCVTLVCLIVCMQYYQQYRSNSEHAYTNHPTHTEIVHSVDANENGGLAKNEQSPFEVISREGNCRRGVWSGG